MRSIKLSITLGVSLALSAMAFGQDPSLPPGIVSKEDPKTFMEAVWKINATPAFFAHLATLPDNGPTINLNFLRYRPRGDATSYDKYAAAAGAGIIGVGGDIVYHGAGVTNMNKAFEMSDEWDGVAYAMYPRRAGYLQLQRDVDYQAGIPDRVAGNYERMLYVLSDGNPIYEATGSIANFHETCTRTPATATDVVVHEFLRFKKPDGRAEYEKFAAGFAPMLADAGGEVMLSVTAETPIVSEEYWDHFVSFRFPSQKVMEHLYQSGKFAEVNAHRIAGVDGTLAVLSTTQILPAKDCD